MLRLLEAGAREGAALDGGAISLIAGASATAEGGGVGSPLARASRTTAARSTSALDFGSNRVNFRVSPGRSRITFSLNATTRPSPRISTVPFARMTSNRSTTPTGFDGAPKSTIPAFDKVWASWVRKSSSLEYGRLIRTATGGRAASVTRLQYRGFLRCGTPIRAVKIERFARDERSGRTVG